VILDTEDPALLAHLNPVEVQMLKNIAQRIGMVARQRVEQAEAERSFGAAPMRVEWASAE
jgi:hypothetical protein